MFRDDSIAGSWQALLARLDARSTVTRWGDAERALTGYQDGSALAARLDRQVYGPVNDEVVAALVRRAQQPSDDALLFLLHCLSGVATGLARDLGDLHDDILAIVVVELTCHIKSFPIERRQRAVAESLRLETRRGVLAELKPSVRNHPELGERLTADGLIESLIGGSRRDLVSDDDIDVADLLSFAVDAGIDRSNLRLVVDMETARAAVAGTWQRSARRSDHDVALVHGICDRTLYRRRSRTLAELRTVARDYLAAVA